MCYGYLANLLLVIWVAALGQTAAGTHDCQDACEEALELWNAVGETAGLHQTCVIGTLSLSLTGRHQLCGDLLLCTWGYQHKPSEEARRRCPRLPKVHASFPIVCADWSLARADHSHKPFQSKPLQGKAHHRTAWQPLVRTNAPAHRGISPLEWEGEKRSQLLRIQAAGHSWWSDSASVGAKFWSSCQKIFCRAEGLQGPGLLSSAKLENWQGQTWNQIWQEKICPKWLLNKSS